MFHMRARIPYCDYGSNVIIRIIIHIEVLSGYMGVRIKHVDISSYRLGKSRPDYSNYTLTALVV